MLFYKFNINSFINSDYKVRLSISEINRLINIQMLTISYSQSNIIESLVL